MPELSRGKKNPLNNVSLCQQYDVVPATPLVTSSVLREETDQWQEVQQGMSLALQEMRIDTDQGIILKNPKENSNKSSLAKKRMKLKTEKAPTPIREQEEDDESLAGTRL